MTKTKKVSKRRKGQSASKAMLAALHSRRCKAWEKFIDAIGTSKEPGAFLAFTKARHRYEVTKYR